MRCVEAASALYRRVSPNRGLQGLFSAPNASPAPFQPLAGFQAPDLGASARTILLILQASAFR